MYVACVSLLVSFVALGANVLLFPCEVRFLVAVRATHVAVDAGGGSNLDIIEYLSIYIYLFVLYTLL